MKLHVPLISCTDSALCIYFRSVYLRSTNHEVMYDLEEYCPLKVLENEGCLIFQPALWYVKFEVLTAANMKMLCLLRSDDV